MKINPASATAPQPLIQAINGNFSKPLKVRILSFTEFMRAKSVTNRKNVYYKDVRLVKGQMDYLEYWYRIPPELPKELWKGEWLSTGGQLKEWGRFRIKDGVNGKSPEEQQGKLDLLLDALEEGYDPFAPLMAFWNEEVAPIQAFPAAPIASPLTLADKLQLSLEGAVDLFLKQYEKTPSLGSHLVMKNLLMDYFKERVKSPLSSFTGSDLESLLVDKNNSEDWKKSTYNDKVKKFITMFGYFKTKELLPTNLAESLKLKTKVTKTKHTPYDDLLAIKVKGLLLNHEDQPQGKFVHDYCSVIYYTCTRPDKETRQLKCEDVKWETNQMYIHPDRAKGGAGGFIPMCAELRDLFLEMGVDKAPGDYYIFGSDYKPGPECKSESWFSWFWREKVRKPNNLHEDYTPYGWKHTRVIHLYLANASAYEIQELCRHSEFSQTEEYLKDLGLLTKHGTSKKTRKF